MNATDERRENYKNQNTTNKTDRTWIPDHTQQVVIDAYEGLHLVLAPPGCGKTQILTERIRKAHEKGMAYEDMLCLTFTNRAARGMRQRITEYIDDPETDNLYVGNVHRFCSKFLFENNIVSASTSIIDEDDAVSILARYLDEDEEKVAQDYQRLSSYRQIVFFSQLMYQLEHNHPKELRLHPECLTREDITAIRYICQVENSVFTREKLIDIYNHNDYYSDATRMDGYNFSMRHSIDNLLHKMRYAHAYTAYKRQNHLVDFEDLLLLTYDYLRTHNHRFYPWMQVDEVQDLNPMQFAILDLLVGYSDKEGLPQGASVMYLGDYQQAIFSFMGAKLNMLDVLRKRCREHIHHLGVNHRSPSYLLDVFNTYAEKQLGIAPELLPQPDNQVTAKGDELLLMESYNEDAEFADVAQLAASIKDTRPHETTAIVVTANKDADRMSELLTKRKLPHFKVSGKDLFSTPEVKLLLAHFDVIGNDLNFIAWSRILHSLRICDTQACARQFVRQLFVRALTPADFLSENPIKSYVECFAETYAEQELVIFDTETTGLDVTEDDILQIAAVKVRKGKVVPGSEFSVYIETDREIPRMLGDVVNPIIEERKNQKLLPHTEALQQFLDYVGTDPILGHNADYDYNIIDYNLRRYLPDVSWRKEHPVCFDSLKLARLLEPGLTVYKLKHLIEVLHLEGENSHLADADVNATRSLVDHCFRKALEILPRQKAFLAEESTQRKVRKLRAVYQSLYLHTLNRCYELQPLNAEPVMMNELRYVHQTLCQEQYIKKVTKLNYIIRFITSELINTDEEHCLRQQMDRHLVEMNTLKEADLCNTSVVDERIFVTTVHKAKGLEFDDVIVFDANDGRYPNYYNRNLPEKVREDARLFYVAISRAKRRLYIARSLQRIGYDGRSYPRDITPFMNSILSYFKRV
ncbi:MAG: 3'-5' exonuclease [Prevotella sp.]|jgi:DNA helicase-2/ATP-dependent DNA helicase PcrA